MFSLIVPGRYSEFLQSLHIHQRNLSLAARPTVNATFKTFLGDGLYLVHFLHRESVHEANKQTKTSPIRDLR